MRGAECVDYCGRNEGVGMSRAGQRWAARGLRRAKSARNWARSLCPWRYGRWKLHTGIRWACSLALHAIRQAGFFDVVSDFPARGCGWGGEFADGVEQGADAGVVALNLALQFGQLVGEGLVGDQHPAQAHESAHRSEERR